MLLAFSLSAHGSSHYLVGNCTNGPLNPWVLSFTDVEFSGRDAILLRLRGSTYDDQNSCEAILRIQLTDFLELPAYYSCDGIDIDLGWPQMRRVYLEHADQKSGIVLKYESQQNTPTCPEGKFQVTVLSARSGK